MVVVTVFVETLHATSPIFMPTSDIAKIPVRFMFFGGLAGLGIYII